MSLPVVIRPYLDVQHLAATMPGIDAVFFQSSNTQAFDGETARAAFRERWLGRYLAQDPRWAYIALTDSGDVAGYLVGCTDDPAVTPRFSDIPYFSHFKDLTQRFPAHLHVNLAASHRSAGIGSALVERFAKDVRGVGCQGVHVVTSRGARNVQFYRRIGFSEYGSAGEGAGEVVLLGREI